MHVFLPSLNDHRVGALFEPASEQCIRRRIGLDPIASGGVEHGVAFFGRDGAVAPGDLDEWNQRNGRQGFGAHTGLNQTVQHVLFDNARDMSYLALFFQSRKFGCQLCGQLPIALLEESLFQADLSLFECVAAAFVHNKSPLLRDEWAVSFILSGR